MGRRPPPAVLVRPEDVLAAIRTSMMLGAVVPELRGEPRLLHELLDELRVGLEGGQDALDAHVLLEPRRAATHRQERLGHAARAEPASQLVGAEADGGAHQGAEGSATRRARRSFE